MSAKVSTNQVSVDNQKFEKPKILTVKVHLEKKRFLNYSHMMWKNQKLKFWEWKMDIWTSVTVPELVDIRIQ